MNRMPFSISFFETFVGSDDLPESSSQAVAPNVQQGNAHVTVMRKGTTLSDLRLRDGRRDQVKCGSESVDGIKYQTILIKSGDLHDDLKLKFMFKGDEISVSTFDLKNSRDNKLEAYYFKDLDDSDETTCQVTISSNDGSRVSGTFEGTKIRWEAIDDEKQGTVWSTLNFQGSFTCVKS